MLYYAILGRDVFISLHMSFVKSCSHLGLLHNVKLFRDDSCRHIKTTEVYIFLTSSELLVARVVL